MAGKVGTSAMEVEAGDPFLEKVGPHAPKIMLAACALGLIAAFLPAVTVSLLGVSESVAVWRDWRGKLALLGYVGVGVMAARMLRRELPDRVQVLACAITAGVVMLLALWLPLSIRGSELGSAVSMGIGVYINILAGLGLAAGAVLQARRSKVC
jgi:hypothetical protein